MSVNLKKIILTAGICFIIPAAAISKVTPVHEYKPGEFGSSKMQKWESAEEAQVSCGMMGWYDNQQTGATCQKKLLADGTECWSCVCDSVYQYTETQCTSTGFVKGSDYCKLGENPARYKDCPCNTAGKYYDSSLYVSSVTSNFKYNGVIATINGSQGGSRTCYNYSAFDCKSGSKLNPSQVSGISGEATAVTFKAKDDSQFITYKAKSIFSSITDSKNIYCTTGLTLSSPLYADTNRPSNTNDCAEFVGNGSAKYSPYTPFGYFNGNCSTSSQCVDTGASGDCVDYGGNAVDTYVNGAKSTVTCKYVRGCKEGVTTIGSDTVLCAASTTNTNSAYFTSTTVNSGNLSCKKITACTSPYEKANLGTTTTTDYTKAGNYVYDVQKVTSGTGEMVCRTPIGCRLDLTPPLYDYTCGTGCWSGHLYLWKNDPTACRVGMNYNMSTKKCNSNSTPEDYIYIRSGTVLDFATSKTLTTTGTYSDTPLTTPCSSSGGTPITKSELDSLQTWLSKNAQDTCIVATDGGTAKIYQINKDGSASVATADTQCFAAFTSHASQNEVTVFQTSPLAFAAVSLNPDTEIEGGSLSGAIMGCYCANVEADGECSRCVDGCYLASGGTCQSCSTGCAECTSATICTTCKTGYYLRKNTTDFIHDCVACPTGCSACTSATVCTSCSSGYSLSGNSCEEDTTTSFKITYYHFCKVNG